MADDLKIMVAFHENLARFQGANVFVAPDGGRLLILSVVVDGALHILRFSPDQARALRLAVDDAEAALGMPPAARPGGE